MGLRMYCDNYPINKYHLPGDNESPKFYGYVSEEDAGQSFKYLKEGLKCINDYDTFFSGGWTESIILSPSEFITFINWFIIDLKSNGYEPRESWLDFIDKLKQTPYSKVIEWS